MSSTTRMLIGIAAALVLLAAAVGTLIFLATTKDPVNASQIVSAIVAVVSTVGAGLSALWGFSQSQHTLTQAPQPPPATPDPPRSVRSGRDSFVNIGGGVHIKNGGSVALVVAVAILVAAALVVYFLFFKPRPLLEVGGTIVCADGLAVTGVYAHTASGNREGFTDWHVTGQNEAVFTKRVVPGDPWQVSVGCGFKPGSPRSWLITNDSGYRWADHRIFECSAPPGSATGTCVERPS